MIRKPVWQVDNPFAKLLVLLGLVVFFLCLFSIATLMLVKPLFGVDVSNPELMKSFGDPAVLNALKFLQAVYSIGMFIVPPIVFAALTSTSAGRYLKISRKPLLSSSVLVIAAVLVAIPFINWLGELNRHMSLPSWMSGIEASMKASEESLGQLTKAFLDMHSMGEMFFMIFLIALIPALGEELLFRATLQDPLVKLTRNVHAGILLTAILFSALHMQFYGFLPRMLLGMYLGYLYLWSGNLWIPILAHFTNNGAAVVFEYLKSRSVFTLDTDSIGTKPEDGIVVFFSFVLFSLLSYLIYKKEKAVVY